jgi:hypothetical protein
MSNIGNHPSNLGVSADSNLSRERQDSSCVPVYAVLEFAAIYQSSESVRGSGQLLFRGRSL